ncbi:MAG: DUF3343 domain-containing protein [Candidatus Cloacimonadota bacterium]|nr:MAG: DUF3343 domain-containing protein [Candidatus Cloacimonadota bacterium]
MKYVITFASVHFVMKAERVLKENGIEVRLIPTPRKISSDCGMTIEVKKEDLDTIKELLKNREYRLENIHELPS